MPRSEVDAIGEALLNDTIITGSFPLLSPSAANNIKLIWSAYTVYRLTNYSIFIQAAYASGLVFNNCTVTS